MMNCKDCNSKFCAVHSLNDQEVNLLSRNCTNVNFKKGELIVKQGSLTTNVVYIKTGLVKEHMTGPNNKEEILMITKPFSFIGMPSILGDKVNHYSCTALEDTTACIINSEVMKNLIIRNGKFAYQLLTYICKDQLNNFQRCVNKIQKHLHGCIADALLFFSDKIYESDEFDMSVTRADLACLIGSTRESVSRTLMQFCNDSIIELNTKKIKILNRELLEKISMKG